MFFVTAASQQRCAPDRPDRQDGRRNCKNATAVLCTLIIRVVHTCAHACRRRKERKEEEGEGERDVFLLLSFVCVCAYAQYTVLSIQIEEIYRRSRSSGKSGTRTRRIEETDMACQVADGKRR